MQDYAGLPIQMRQICKPASNIDQSLGTRYLLNQEAEGEDNKDLLFLADPSRSATDVNRAITAARHAGFTVYQSPPLKPDQ